MLCKIIILIIFEIISRSYSINNIEYNHHTKIIINTEEKLIYTNYPNKVIKHYNKDNLIIYKDSIVLDSIVYKKLKIKMFNPAVNNKPESDTTTYFDYMSK